MKCALCSEPVEDETDQVVGAELCNSCAAYLDAKFGALGDVLSDPATYENLPDDNSNT